MRDALALLFLAVVVLVPPAVGDDGWTVELLDESEMDPAAVDLWKLTTFSQNISAASLARYLGEPEPSEATRVMARRLSHARTAPTRWDSVLAELTNFYGEDTVRALLDTVEVWGGRVTGPSLGRPSTWTVALTAEAWHDPGPTTAARKSVMVWVEAGPGQAGTGTFRALRETYAGSACSGAVKVASPCTENLTALDGREARTGCVTASVSTQCGQAEGITTSLALRFEERDENGDILSETVVDDSRPSACVVAMCDGSIVAGL